MSDGDVVATFMAITGCTEDEAVGYLSEADFDLAIAQSLYIESGNDRLPEPSPADISNTPGSPGYTTPPYLVSRLDGGVGRQEQFPANPQDWLGSHGNPFQQRSQAPNTHVDLPSMLFMTPYFVHEGTTPFTNFCVRALEGDQWVLLSLLGNDFKSLCVNRDIWRSETVRETFNMFSIYQANISTERGEELLNGYRLDRDRDLPVLIIINPLTTMKESRVTLNFIENAIDVSEVNEMLLSFVAERGSPSQWESKKHQGRATNVPSKATTSQAITVHDIDDDDDDNNNNDNNNKFPHFIASQPTESVSSSVQPPSPPPPPPPRVKEIDISLYEASLDDKNAFSLRFRMPNGQLTLRLKPDTPAQLLVNYIAYRAYKDQPEAYPQGVPNCSLKAGYPTKELHIEDPQVQLVNWGGLRSGDTVFLHIQ